MSEIQILSSEIGKILLLPCEHKQGLSTLAVASRGDRGRRLPPSLVSLLLCDPTHEFAAAPRGTSCV